METDPQSPASRVFQLEAQGLDDEFDKFIDQVIETIGVPRVSDELKVLLKLFVSASQAKRNTTVGMHAFKMRYFRSMINETDKTIRTEAGWWRQLTLAALNVLLPYLSKKQDQLQNLLDRSPLASLKYSWLTINNALNLLRLLSVINFLTFISGGKHLLLQERILGVVPGLKDSDHAHNHSMNRVQIEMAHRETVWRVIAEFLTAVIPLVNLTRAKAYIMHSLGSMSDYRSELKLAEKLFSVENLKRCAICGKQPFNPYIIGCRHLFCYYCLQAKHLSGPAGGYSCSTCKYNTNDPNQLQRYRAINNLT